MRKKGVNRLVAQLLLGILFFENCTHINPPVWLEEEKAAQEKTVENYATLNQIEQDEIHIQHSLPEDINLGLLNGTQGAIIAGQAGIPAHVGLSVSGVGDVNGDGIADMLIGSNVDGYLLYGSKTFPSSISVQSLDSKQGVVIKAEDGLGVVSVSGVGDVNGDGVLDMLIGIPGERNSTGASYVVYGGSNLPSSIKLASLNKKQGLTIHGAKMGDAAGLSVSGLGDVNGDGFPDILIGAPNAMKEAGIAYVVYGGNNLSGAINLNSLKKAQGMSIGGAKAGDRLGLSVSGVGDVNGDGIADILIGAFWANRAMGSAYLVYGSKMLPANLVLSSLNGTQGITMYGLGFAGKALSSAGDINGDGLSDMLIGAEEAQNVWLGASYLVYGDKSLPSEINLGYWDDKEGITMHGSAEIVNVGSSVSGVGDVNGDGNMDMLIGAKRANYDSGASYVVYGVNPSKNNKFLWELKDKGPSETSSASTPKTFWSSASSWVSSLKGWWNEKQLAVDLTTTQNPDIRSITSIKNNCQKLIEEASQVSKDKWYQYSLEDLEEEIEKALQDPETITDETARCFNSRLESIKKDFLQDPLLETPSFFAAIRDRVEMTGVMSDNKINLSPSLTLPMLGSGYIAYAIGN
jgi:hypothetical protein